MKLDGVALRSLLLADCLWNSAAVDPIRLVQNLCFTKKIRYESRKQLAQARPRVKGQFVRVGDIADAVDALTENGKVCYLPPDLPMLGCNVSLHCVPLVHARIRLL